MALTAAKLDQVSRVFAVTPDAVLRRLERVLADGRTVDPELGPVYELAAAERRERELFERIFEPLIPLAEPVAAPKRQLITRAALRQAWRAAAKADPDLVNRVAAWPAPKEEEPAPPEYDEACTFTADIAEEGAENLARLLRLAPSLRAVRRRVEGWVDQMNGENTAALRVAHRDATAIAEDAGPAFWEALFTYLERPWTIIRLISAVADKPSDRFLAGSELSSIGERLMEEVDALIAAIKGFDPLAGEAAAAVAAEQVAQALAILAEFEEWLALKRDGPWGGRINEQKRAIAQFMESRLREAEAAVGAALPTHTKGGGKGARVSPKLSADPQPLLAARAIGLIALTQAVRPSAHAGGFASLRTKVVENTAQRLDQYCDDVLAVLRGKTPTHDGEPPDEVRIREYLDIAASLMGMVQGADAAQIVRRRMAAA